MSIEKIRFFATALMPVAFVVFSQIAIAQNHKKTFITQNDTMYINSDILVADNDSLIIDPGTVVMFMGHYSIHVQGKLIAAGTPFDSIIFTVADTVGFSDMYSTAGGWNGIRFEDTPSTNDSSMLAFCRFEFGKAMGDSASSFGGAIRLIRFHKLKVSHSSFVNNYSFLWGGGIHALKSSILVEHCLFANNYSGNDQPEVWGYGAGMSFVSSNPTIRFCNFTNNTSTGTGGGIAFEYSNPEMINCVFTGNYSALGGAISFLRCQPDRTIANILVHNNEAMYFGGGIANITGSPMLSNFTITENYAPMGGGYYCNEYAHPKLFNSILWGNTAGDGTYDDGSQVWIWDVNSEPGFYHCNIQFGTEEFGGSTFTGAYENNIDNDPLFTDPESFDFTIMQYSPCINSGTPDTTGLSLPEFDLALNSRIIHNMVDMGVYEYDGPLGAERLLKSKESLLVYPNPVNSQSIVSFQLQDPITVTLVLRNLHGNVAGYYNYRAAEQGTQRIFFNKIAQPENLATGIYIIELHVGELEFHNKILVY